MKTTTQNNLLDFSTINADNGSVVVVTPIFSLPLVNNIIGILSILSVLSIIILR
jgi:hypothetical protein